MAHEVAHALVALRCGLRVRRITLSLLGGVSELGGSPPGPGVEVPVAVAGPLALTFFRKASGRSRSQRRLTAGWLTPNTAPATSCVTFLRIKNTTMAARGRPAGPGADGGDGGAVIDPAAAGR